MAVVRVRRGLVGRVSSEAPNETIQALRWSGGLVVSVAMQVSVMLVGTEMEQDWLENGAACQRNWWTPGASWIGDPRPTTGSRAISSPSTVKRAQAGPGLT